MHNKKGKILITIMLIIGLTDLQAQETLPVSGGNALGNGGSASYTVGQVSYSTNTGSNGSAAQGVQQPYEISVISGIKGGENVNLICSTYPNPTNDFVTLKVENYGIVNFTFQLYDINGRLLENKIIEGNETIIDMKILQPSIYFIKVIDNNKKEVKTFKIIKK